MLLDCDPFSARAEVGHFGFNAGPLARPCAVPDLTPETEV